MPVKVTRILSASRNLKQLNSDLEDKIEIFSIAKLSDQINSKFSFCVLFEWQNLYEVVQIKNELSSNKIFGTRFICVNSDIQPEDRIKLINNNLEYLTLEKFATTHPYYFQLNEKNEKYSLLVLEGDPNQLAELENTLNSAHINTTPVNNSLHTLDQIKENSPDLILMGFHIPDLSADKLIENIRANETYKNIPIVVLTSDSSESTRIKAIKAGADDILNKPINDDLLVAALINRMQRAVRLNNSKNKTDQVGVEHLHALNKKKQNELLEFIIENKESESSSIIWLKIENAKSLQKQIGFIDYKNFCNIVLNKLKNLASIRFEHSLIVADNAMAFTTKKLTKANATKWAHAVLKWINSNLFSFNHNKYKLETKAIILSDLPNKSAQSNLISEAESAILEGFLEGGITHIADGIEEKNFYQIKKQLEHAIQVRSFKWWYQTIVSTQDPEQEIFQLYLRAINENGEEIAPNDFYQVGKKTGLLRIFDRFTFEHSLRILDFKNSGSKKRVLINQNLADFESKQEKQRKLEMIQDLNIPENSLIFQFRLHDVINHKHLLEETAQRLKQGKIKICISHFDGSEEAWNLASQFSVDWIRFLPLGEKPQWNELGHADHISNSIDKAHKEGYKVMVSEVDSAEFAASSWSLKFDYMQGFFIQNPVLEEPN